jgi:dephospho-CoA kinase
MQPLVFCITGGIASGKTFVSDQMQAHGFEVIDADIVAREVVAKGQPTLNKIVESFGDAVLKDDGCLDRSKLKHLVFTNEENLKVLNRIVHPAIRKRIMSGIQNIEKQCVLLVIPLLSEAMIKKFQIKRVLVVDVAERIQLKRVMNRDGVAMEIAQSIIKSQQDRETRMSLATDVIVNNEGFNELTHQVKLVSRLYQSIKRIH